MPLIELDGSPDIGWVMAVMLHPQDKRLREQFYLAHKVRLELSMLEEDSATAGVRVSKIDMEVKSVRLLLEAPSWDEIKRLSAECTKRAVIAGDILSCIYLMKIFGMDEPSLNKAIHAMREYAADGATYGDGAEVPKSEIYLRKYWNEFQSVAHLWAAFRINQSYPFTDQRGAFSHEGFPTFLGVAQGFYEFGSSFIPYRARPKNPILDTNNSWQIPKAYKALQLKTERLPQKLVSFLKNYSAPLAKY